MATTGDRLVEISNAPNGSTAEQHLLTTYKARVQVYETDFELSESLSQSEIMATDLTTSALDALSQTTTITNSTATLEVNNC